MGEFKSECELGSDEGRGGQEGAPLQSIAVSIDKFEYGRKVVWMDGRMGFISDPGPFPSNVVQVLAGTTYPVRSAVRRSRHVES